MQRRDLLKLFGIGASIAPIVNGMPRIEAAANLIELPKVEPVSLESAMPNGAINDFLNSHARECDIRVSIRAASGTVYHFKGATFVYLDAADADRRYLASCIRSDNDQVSGRCS